MATSGKKAKKKAKAVPLQDFLANGNSNLQPGVAQVTKKVRSRDDSDDDDGSFPQIFQLPTAPRANRLLEDDSIPHKPPFLAFVTHLPFDIQDEDIYDFFDGIKILSIRLPREDGEYGRLRGFGYIEFENRDDLIYAIGLPDPHIKNRRIRIDVASSENEHQQQRRGNRSRYEGFGNSSENRDSTNWRSKQDFLKDDDRDRDRDRKGGFGYRDRERPQRDDSSGTGSWRTGDRPSREPSSPIRRSGFSRRKDDDFRGKDEKSEPQERPKLKLNPRTLPLPEIIVKPLDDEDEKSKELENQEEDRRSTPEPPPQKPKPTGVPAEKVFGDAKPVDTAAKEKEIEERLARLQKLEEERLEKEKEEAVSEKSEETALGKDEKENRNVVNWRRRDNDQKQESDYRKYSPDRNRGSLRRSDDRRGGPSSGRDRDGRRDFNRGFDHRDKNLDNRDRNIRNDRDNYNRGGRDRGFNKDGLGKGGIQRDNRDNKNRVGDDRQAKPKDRPEKPMPKFQPSQVDPVVSTTNKYAVFISDEETD